MSHNPPTGIDSNNYKHGKSWTPTWRTWQVMKTRCLNPNFNVYHHYGGRGIKVCDRWLGVNGFANFFEDMGERPDGMTIDRIDVNGNYEPNNCRWATHTEQHRNMRVQRGSKSGKAGVTLYKPTGNWRVRIVVDKKSISLGYYRTLDEAIKARQNAEKTMWLTGNDDLKDPIYEKVNR